MFTIVTFLSTSTIERFIRVLGNRQFKRHDYLWLENILSKQEILFVKYIIEVNLNDILGASEKHDSYR